MSSTTEWEIYRGTIEYRTLTVTSTNVDLTSQAVRISWDRVTWIDAEWIGDPGKIRKARVLLDDELLPGRDVAPVFLKLTDHPEIPILKAGQARFL